MLHHRNDPIVISINAEMMTGVLMTTLLFGSNDVSAWAFVREQGYLHWMLRRSRFQHWLVRITHLWLMLFTVLVHLAVT